MVIVEHVLPDFGVGNPSCAGAPCSPHPCKKKVLALWGCASFEIAVRQRSQVASLVDKNLCGRSGPARLKPLKCNPPQNHYNKKKSDF